ncbi:MAG: hypothetical protein AAGG01_13275, partial [Planctomycetota bacterium]
MNQSPAPPWTHPLLAFGIAVSALPACSGTSSPIPSGPGGVQNGAGTSTSFFFQDVHSGGASSEVKLTGLSYGRLVQVEGLNDEGLTELVAQEFVINQNLVSDSLNYELSSNGVTGQETLLIKRNIDDTVEFQQLLNLLEQAGAELAPIRVEDVATTGTYSMVPRNAALVLTFDDLILPRTVSARSVEVLQGYPPSSPFEARIFTSAHHGGLAANGSFYPTRVIVDTTNSLVEVLQTGNSLELNGVGLGPSVEMNQANVQIRIPTVANPSIGLTQVLTNLSGQALATENNGPVDFSTNTRPVTRAMRSGGRRGVIADPFNGFLPDTTPPKVVGSTPLQITVPPVQVRDDPADTGSLRFTLPEVRLPSTLCGRGELKGGDVISQPGLFARILRADDSSALAYLPDGEGKVYDLPVELITFPLEWDNPAEFEQFGAVASNLERVFSPAEVPECFVQVIPSASGFPSAPTQGVDPAAVFQLRFSEPMDTDSLTAFDSVTLARRASSPLEPLLTSEYVVGELSQDSLLRKVTFAPVLDLAHSQGTAETYFMDVADADDAFPPRDLAGNTIDSMPQIPVAIDAVAPSRLNGGRVSRFSSSDEEPPFGFPEWGGQIQFDPGLQLVRPRPVIRQRAVIDNAESALAAQMTSFPPGVVTPFSPLGSKMQTLWRYADCGFSL